MSSDSKDIVRSKAYKKEIGKDRGEEYDGTIATQTPQSITAHGEVFDAFALRLKSSRMEPSYVEHYSSFHAEWKGAVYRERMRKKTKALQSA